MASGIGNLKNIRTTKTAQKKGNKFTQQCDTRNKLKCGKGNDSSAVLAAIPNKAMNKNLDDILEAVKNLDNTCKFPKCMARTNLIGLDCGFCKKKFCFKHGLPEIHGCGNAVRKHEREKFLRRKPLKTVRHENELCMARDKLHEKLKDMQIARVAKAPGVTANGGKKKK